MPERVVAVRLSAKVGEYNQSMREAARNTKEVGTEAEKLSHARQSFEAIGRAGLVMGGLITSGLALGIAKYAEFDQAMSNVIATGEDAAKNQQALREAAIEAGESTVFSATESANAIEELVKAGLTAEQVLGGGLSGALDLAAASGMGVADAAAVMATSLQQFQLAGEDSTHVADLLAAGASKAMGDVSDLGQALDQAGLVANQFGVGVEETVGTLAAFANAGMLGSDAGTSFRTMLLRLANPTGEVKDLMADLNIQAYDQQGNFVGLANLAGNLETSLAGMTQAQRDQTLAMIFGQDAIRGANILLREGKDGIEDWTAAVDDQGYAASVARDRVDNLKGDLEALGGAMDTALIQTGSGANDTLRALVQSLGGLVDLYNDLPAPVQQAVMAIGGGTAAVALAGGAAFTAIPRFIEFRSTLDGAGLSMGRVAANAGIAGVALGGLFLIVGELARRHAEAQMKARSYADTLTDGTNKLTDASRDFAKENLAAEQSWLWISRGSAYDAAEKLGLSLDTVTDAATGNVDALRELEDIMKAGEGQTDAAQRVADKYGLSLLDAAQASTVLTEAIMGENAGIEEAIRVNEQKNQVTGEGAEVTMTAADAYMAAEDQASNLSDTLSQLIETINKANGVGQDAISSNLDYQNALAAVDETIAKAREGQEGYALTLDTSTQAGRDNLDMLNDMASKSQDAAGAQFALDQNTEAYRQSLINGRQDLITRAQDLGYSADEATRLADQIYRIPPEREFEVIANTNPAELRLAWLTNPDRYKLTIPVFADYKGGPIPGAGTVLKVPGQAMGGPVHGPGTGTSDSVLRWLSNGEHVLTAAEVDAAGGHARVEKFRAALMSRTADAPDMPIDPNATKPETE